MLHFYMLWNFQIFLKFSFFNFFQFFPFFDIFYFWVQTFSSHCFNFAPFQIFLNFWNLFNFFFIRMIFVHKPLNHELSGSFSAHCPLFFDFMNPFENFSYEPSDDVRKKIVKNYFQAVQHSLFDMHCQSGLWSIFYKFLAYIIWKLIEKIPRWTQCTQKNEWKNLFSSSFKEIHRNFFGKQVMVSG